MFPEKNLLRLQIQIIIEYEDIMLKNSEHFSKMNKLTKSVPHITLVFI